MPKQCLSEIGVDGKDIKITIYLYWEQTATVKIINELSVEMRIRRGVRQGVASPTLQFIHGLVSDIFSKSMVSTWEAKLRTILT